MKQIKLSVTATRTGVANQFRGIITLENNHGDQVRYEYMFKRHSETNEYLDIKFHNKSENFNIYGVVTHEVLNALENNQSWIFLTSIKSMLSAVREVEILPNNLTKIMKAFGEATDTHSKICIQKAIEDSGHDSIFEKEMEENKMLESF